MIETSTNDELVPLTRHEVPRSRLNNKYLQRYRNTFKYDGNVSKIILIDTVDTCSLSKNGYDELYQKVKHEVQSDGMSNFYVIYSLGKRRRWEMAKMMEDYLPDPIDCIASYSVLRFNEQRTHCNESVFGPRHGMLHCHHNKNPCEYYYSKRLEEFSVKSEDTLVSRKGRFNYKQPVIFPSKSVHRKSNSSIGEELQIHVQYHVQQYTFNKKYHNSEKHRFWHDGRDQYCKPIIEGCRMNSDVVKTGNCCYATAIWETNENHPFDEEIEEVEAVVAVPKGLTLADFLVPRLKKQRRRKTMSEQWVFV